MDATDLDILTLRTLPAPRERVFAAWLDPDQLARWWGPAGFTNTFHEFEPEEGGAWRFVMHGPHGDSHPNECRFVEIERPERLVIDHLSAPRFRITATFEAAEDATRLSYRMRFDSARECEAVKALAGSGNQQMFDRLAALLSED